MKHPAGHLYEQQKESLQKAKGSFAPTPKKQYASVLLKKYASLVWGFTLVELLIVIGILAILIALVVVVMNPTELLRQSRDSVRIGDLSGLKDIIQLVLTQQPSVSLGTASTVYVSIPDSASSTCGSLGLPDLPSGYTYACASEASYKNSDGTGWIPVNFNTDPKVTSLTSLPVDPINTTSSGKYYTYTAGGSFELNAALESVKYRVQSENDGGDSYVSFEKGNNLTLHPVSDSGLLFDLVAQEGSLSDRLGRTLTNTNVSIVKDTKYVASFNGSDSKIDTGSDWIGTSAVSILAWIRPSSKGEGSSGRIIDNAKIILRNSSSASNLYVFQSDGSTSSVSANNAYTAGTYAHIAITRSAAGTANFYLNGSKNGTPNQASGAPASGTTNVIIGNNSAQGGTFDGYIYGFRVFNRVLSPAEIYASYSGTN